MRYIIFLHFLFFVVLAENPHQEKGLQEGIAKLKIKCIQNKLISGVPEYGVPSFAPLNLDDVINIDIDKLNIPYISGNFNLEKINLEGIVEWTITDMKVSILGSPKKIMAELTFPSILFESKSLTDLTILIMKLSGNNAAKLNINNVVLKIDMEQIPDTEGTLWWQPKITARSDDFLFTLNELLLNGKDIAPKVSQILNSLPQYKDNIIGVLEYIAQLYLNADKSDEDMLEKILRDVIGFVLKFLSINIVDKVLDFDLDPFIAGKVDIKEFNLEGIDDFTLENITVKTSSPKSVMAELNFPSIFFESEFKTDLIILNKTISREGFATFSVKNFDYKIDWREPLEVKEEHNYWSASTTTFNYEELLKVKLSEFLVNGQDISQIVSNLILDSLRYINDMDSILEYISYLNIDTTFKFTPSINGLIEIIAGIKQILAECI